MIVIIISSIVLIIGASLIASGYDGPINQLEINIGIVMVIASIILGFFLFGAILPTGGSKTNIIIPQDPSKGEFIVYAEIDGKTLFSKDAKIVAAPLDKIRIEKRSSLNSYGCAIEENYQIILAD